MTPDLDTFLSPEGRPEATPGLEALRFLYVHKPELVQVLDEIESQKQMLLLYIEGYEHGHTRQLIIALLRSTYGRGIPMLIDPNGPPPAPPRHPRTSIFPKTPESRCVCTDEKRGRTPTRSGLRGAFKVEVCLHFLLPQGP